MSQRQKRYGTSFGKKIMGVLATHDDLIKLYYNSNSLKAREVLTYLKSSNFNLLVIDTALEGLSELQWEEILTGLNKEVVEVIDKNKIGKLDGNTDAKDFSTADWLKILKHNPEIIKGFIISKGDEYYQFDSPKSVIKHIADTADSSNTNRE